MNVYQVYKHLSLVTSADGIFRPKGGLFMQYCKNSCPTAGIFLSGPVTSGGFLLRFIF